VAYRESEYSVVRHLCWGVFLNHNSERTWIAVVTEYATYLDDSGHPADQPYVVAAGFLSTEAGWLAFEPEWKSALHKHGIGSVFHMADFHGKRDRKTEGRILEDLTGIIAKNTQAVFSVVVEMQSYKKVNDLYPLEESIGTPYAIAARAVGKGINQWKDEFYRPKDHLLMFVEEGTKHMGDMLEAFRRDHLPIPQTVPKAHLAVQAGDLMAWEAFHHAKYHEPRRSLINLVKGKFVFEGIFREKNLMHAIKKLEIPLRTSLPPNVKFVYGTSPKRPRGRTIK